MSDFPSDSPTSPGTSPSGAGTQAKDTIDRLGAEANRRAREFESEPQRPGDSFRGAARETAEEARREGSKIAREVKDRALGYAEARKDLGADRLQSVASAVERAASDIESESPQVAGYIRDAVGGMRHLSSTLRDRSVDDLIGDARDFARRQPVLVFGGAVLAGLALTRFLKSSAPRREESARYDTGLDGGSHGND